MDNPLDSETPQGAQPAPKPAPSQVSGVQEPIAEAAAQPKAPPPQKTKKRGLHPALLALIIVAVLGVGVFAAIKFGSQLGKTPLAGVESAVKQEQPAGPLAPYVKGSLAHMMTYAQPRAIDDLAFVDRDRKPVHLSDFKGQVVVLNLWATWCAPCRFEMPTLAHLQQQYSGKGLKVLPLSGDNDDNFDDVKSFIDAQEPADALSVYVDSSLIEKTQKLDVQGLPATIILDKQGREVARLDGEAVWDTPEAKALMDKLLSQ